jgi:hypothetical protein
MRREGAGLSLNLVQPDVKVGGYPLPPDTIEAGVMQIEDWVWRSRASAHRSMMDSKSKRGLTIIAGVEARHISTNKAMTAIMESRIGLEGKAIE